MKPASREADTLDRLVSEARTEQTPELDWDAIESSLMKRVAEAPAVRERRRPPVVPFFLGAAAAAAAAAVVFVVRGPVVVPAPSPAESTAERAAVKLPRMVDGDALSPGAVVTSGAEAVVVEHRGHAKWTLAPESTAHVESVGEVVALSLDRGEVSSEVVKSPKPESFVVRVERTRVAVHGTRFRVSRLADSVRVDVQEGVVGVGPVGQPGFELRAPSGATLTFDGVRTDVPPSAARERPAEAAAAPTATARHVVRPKSAYFAPIEPDGLPRGALAGVERTMSSVQRCLAEHTVSGDDVRVSVETTLTLRVDPKGTVGEALFAPPLAPGVGACVDDALEQIQFPRSAGGFVAYRVLELNR